MNDIQACSPTSLNCLAEESLEDIVEHYKIKLGDEKLVVAKKLYKGSGSSLTYSQFIYF